MELEIIALIVGIASGVSGGVLTAAKFNSDLREKERLRVVEATKKEYAAERDFNHIKRDIEQLKVNLELLFKDSDLRVRQLELELSQIRVKLDLLINSKEDSN